MPWFTPSIVNATRGLADKMPQKLIQDTSFKAVNSKFRNAVIAGWYLSIDHDRKGFVQWEDFSFYFSQCASDQERDYVFRLLDPKNTGQVSYLAFQDFVAQQGVPPACGKVGSPDHMSFPTLLQAVFWALERQPVMELLSAANAPFPPTADWLMGRFLAEWEEDPGLKLYLDYVRNPVPVGKEGRAYVDTVGGLMVRDAGNEGMTLEDFCQRLPALRARLTTPEVAALRLYTGPGFSIINRSLRSRSDRFAVTQYLVDSAIGKLAQHSGPQLLYRGIRGQMPKKWERKYKEGKAYGSKRMVIVDPAVVSTTTDHHVALQNFGGPTVFVLHTGGETSRVRPAGFLDTGADVRWISQSPSEMEVLFPSRTFFIPRPVAQHSVPLDLSLPTNRKVFEFSAYFPWDFAHQCPAVKADGLDAANALLIALSGRTPDAVTGGGDFEMTLRRGSRSCSAPSAATDSSSDSGCEAESSVAKVAYGEPIPFPHPSLRSSPTDGPTPCATPPARPRP